MRGGDKGARMASAMAVVAGRAARPCDVCARKRSRWYCAADEAYLCDACDSSVHAANALAFRHERVRLTPNGNPMKVERRINGDHAPSTASKQKKLKSKSNSNLVPSSPGATFSEHHLQQQQHEKYFSLHDHHNNALREVKVESSPGNFSTVDHHIDPSDDHFTAEELTGNANLLDDTPSMCPSQPYDVDSSHRHGMLPGAGFENDFLVSDPNNTTTTTITTSSAGEGDVIDEDDDEDVDDCVGTEWMELGLDGNRDIDDDYYIDPVALRESASVHDESVALYSHDEKPGAMGSLPSSKMGKPFKNLAGQSEWVKLEEGGYPQNYDINPQQQALATNPLSGTASACKIEGLSMGECDLRHVPSLRLNYEDVLSSWPDRGMRWTDDGSGSQLVPDGSSSVDAMGNCYDLGLVPDLSQCGVDGSGYPAAMYGGCGPGGGMGGTGAGGDDSAANAGNGREARVIRYREKRRTRLFSKKIRYEVRKLNAERRPRMKGRFVKRSPGRDTPTETVTTQ
ncbi:unnamed protein product [Calypogeia fissa]